MDLHRAHEFAVGELIEGYLAARLALKHILSNEKSLSQVWYSMVFFVKFQIDYLGMGCRH